MVHAFDVPVSWATLFFLAAGVLCLPMMAASLFTEKTALFFVYKTRLRGALLWALIFMLCFSGAFFSFLYSLQTH